MANPLGLESGIVRVVEYDARWPALFAGERARLRAVCGALPLRFEHIGGTAIPDMCAKPILDILAGRPAATSLQDCIATLTRAGYEHRGEQGVPGREYFRRGQPMAYHLHLVAAGSDLWRDHLAFRDFLRAHPDTARQFGELKRALAAQFPRDRAAYTSGKSTRIKEILQLAIGV